MDKQSRREAVRQYKERKAQPGIFAVRCRPTGEAWVGPSRNLDQQQNGIWFSLKLGSHRNRELQAAYDQHGADAFAFEVLETCDDEATVAYSLANWLKDAERRWIATLGARKLIA